MKEWKIKLCSDGSRIIHTERKDGDELICRDVRHYNMRLIAAAPKMYEALKDCVQVMETAEVIMGMTNKSKFGTTKLKAYKALAKAEGKA